VLFRSPLAAVPVTTPAPAPAAIPEAPAPQPVAQPAVVASRVPQTAPDAVPPAAATPSRPRSSYRATTSRHYSPGTSATRGDVVSVCALQAQYGITESCSEPWRQ
jgi:hypothetical protein